MNTPMKVYLVQYSCWFDKGHAEFVQLWKTLDRAVADVQEGCDILIARHGKEGLLAHLEKEQLIDGGYVFKLVNTAGEPFEWYTIHEVEISE